MIQYGPVMGTIALFAGNYAPYRWKLCDGATQLIKENLNLYSIIGNTYGGNGQDTYLLPNMQAPIAGLLYIICVMGNYPSRSSSERIVEESVIGEVMLFAGDYIPDDWAICNGKLINSDANPPLASVLRNTFGGDGTTNFALPNIPAPASMNYIICTSGAYPMRS